MKTMTRKSELAVAALVLLLGGVARAADGGAAPAPSPNPHGFTGAIGEAADSVDDDDTLPEGTIRVTILDENDKPRPQFPVTVGVLQNSVAKGESRKHVQIVTDELGTGRIDGLSAATEVAYRISATRDGAAYAARPFNMPKGKGMRVRLHVYPASADASRVQVELQGVLFVDLKDDRVQVEQLFSVMNVGKTAWVPNDLVLPLPSDAQAIRGSQQMNDISVEPVEGRGARVRGTFPPGRNDVDFTWQVPYNGGERVDITVGMPPEVSMFRVIAAAAPKMRLAVDGFPDAVARTDNQGQHVLITERRSTGEEAIGAVHLAITDIPSQGPISKYVTFASAAIVLASIAFASRKKRDGVEVDTSNPKKARAKLLAELEDLERAKLDGDVGPKTYERAHREIIAGIARTLGGAEGPRGQGAKGREQKKNAAPVGVAFDSPASAEIKDLSAGNSRRAEPSSFPSAPQGQPWRGEFRRIFTHLRNRARGAEAEPYGSAPLPLCPSAPLPLDRHSFISRAISSLIIVSARGTTSKLSSTPSASPPSPWPVPAARRSRTRRSATGRPCPARPVPRCR